MSWDIVLFNAKEKISSFEELNEDLLVPIDFCSILEENFKNINADDNYREIVGENFTIDYSTDDQPISNKMLSLYGENAIYALIDLAKKYDWQVFDTALGEMIDLDNPSRNGYENFQNYVRQITKSGREEG